MELDVVEHAVVPVDVARILTDEQMLMALEAKHEIAGADADETLVGRDPDHARIEVPPRPTVPAGVEGRIQRQPVMADGDVGDFHGWRCV